MIPKTTESANTGDVSFKDVYRFFRSELGCQQSSYIRGDGRKAKSIDTGCGIWLHHTPWENYGYWCTPTNSLAFATSGGDGVHFSFLTLEGLVPEKSPVVMTCPATGGFADNIILAENFRGFLSTGLRTGFFALNEIGHGPEKFFSKYPQPDEYAIWLAKEQKSKLAQLQKRFGLEPWINVKETIVALQERYWSLMNFSEEYTELYGYYSNPESPPWRPF